MSESDPLLDRVAAGDQRAVEECLERYGGLVRSLARRYVAGMADVEDAVQEIFIDLWQNASRYDGSKASETTFVAMLARRRLIDRLRKGKRSPATEQLSAAADVEQNDAQPDVEARDEAARADRLIRTLKPVQREVIRLAVHEELTHQGIADALEMPLGTVKTHLRRGLARVREAMRSSDP